ncbi:hypothetical protein MPSEU_001080000 [Mayamaea pseudoterrestris]|nr:hypothetical protein MPSEU_001080000 [Mayamaea pseudoterrestris]
MTSVVSLTGASTTDPIVHHHPSSASTAASGAPTGLTVQPGVVMDAASHSHDHSHSHAHHGAAACSLHSPSSLQRPLVSLNVPVAQLIQDYDPTKPQELFHILQYLVKMGSYQLFHEIVVEFDSKYSSSQANSGSSNSKLYDLLQIRDDHGHSLLHWAAKRSDEVQFVEYLAEQLLSSGKGKSLKHAAAAVEQDKDSSVKDPLHPSLWIDTETGMTPLHWACTEPNNLKIVQILLHATAASKASSSTPSTSTTSISPWLDARDATGCTPLLMAAQQGHVEVCALLLQRGAHFGATDSSKDSATHWAAYKGSLPVLGLLCYYEQVKTRGGNSNDMDFNSSNSMLCAPDAYGQTPLHLAALRGHASVCRYIIQRVVGTSSNAGAISTSKTAAATSKRRRRQAARELLGLKDKNGRTPLELAVHKNQHAVATVMRKQMAWLGVVNQTNDNSSHVGVSSKTAKLNTMRHRLVKTMRATLFSLLRLNTWKRWLGLPTSNGSDNDVGDDYDVSWVDDEAPQFPFYYVKAQVVFNLVFYFYVLCPLLDPGAGVLWDYMGLQIVTLVLYAITFYTLYKTHTTNPGRLTAADDATTQYWRKMYEQTLEGCATTDDGSQQSATNHMNNLCHTCHIVKPPRSKHDRYTHACVLLFDHHCPFVGNTVGLYNYKWFYLFLVSFTVYCTFLLILLGIYCHRQAHLPLTILLIGLYLGLHGLVTAGMWIYHTQLTIMNLTTNEHINLQRYEYFWSSREAESGVSLAGAGRKFHNPWNKGWLANFLDRWEPTKNCYMLHSRTAPQLGLSSLEMQNLLGSFDQHDLRRTGALDNHVV